MENKIRNIGLTPKKTKVMLNELRSVTGIQTDEQLVSIAADSISPSFMQKVDRATLGTIAKMSRPVTGTLDFITSPWTDDDKWAGRWRKKSMAAEFNPDKIEKAKENNLEIVRAARPTRQEKEEFLGYLVYNGDGTPATDEQVSKEFDLKALNEIVMRIDAKTGGDLGNYGKSMAEYTGIGIGLGVNKIAGGLAKIPKINQSKRINFIGTRADGYTDLAVDRSEREQQELDRQKRMEQIRSGALTLPKGF